MRGRAFTFGAGRAGQGRAGVKICIIAATKGFMATLDLVVVHLLIGQMESLRR